MNYKFPKSEKLRLKKDIERLFEKGKNKFYMPLSVKFLKIEEASKNLCGVSVPKRKMKKAVDRNRLKRQMREAYRLNKHILEAEDLKYHMMFVYSKNEKSPYQDIEKAMVILLGHIKKLQQ
jgi:ribonuclease P protein component